MARVKRTVETSVKELEESGKAIINVIQEESFEEGLHALRKGDKVKKRGFIIKWKPFLHIEPLQASGRLANAPLSLGTEHELILPSKHHIIELIMN